MKIYEKVQETKIRCWIMIPAMVQYLIIALISCYHKLPHLFIVSTIIFVVAYVFLSICDFKANRI